MPRRKWTGTDRWLDLRIRQQSAAPVKTTSASTGIPLASAGSTEPHLHPREPLIHKHSPYPLSELRSRSKLEPPFVPRVIRVRSLPAPMHHLPTRIHRALDPLADEFKRQIWRIDLAFVPADEDGGPPDDSRPDPLPHRRRLHPYPLAPRTRPHRSSGAARPFNNHLIVLEGGAA